MDAGASPRAESGATRRKQLRVAACHVSGADRVRPGAVLRRDHRRAGVHGRGAQVLRRLRSVRRRQDGAEGVREPVRPADQHHDRAAAQSGRSGERHAGLEGRQRRRPAAARGAGSLERFRVRHDQPLQSEPGMAGRQRVLVRAAAAASRRHGGVGRLYAARDAAQHRPDQPRRSDIELYPAAGGGSQQRSIGDGLQPEPGASRQVRHRLGQRLAVRHDL